MATLYQTKLEPTQNHTHVPSAKTSSVTVTISDRLGYKQPQGTQTLNTLYYHSALPRVGETTTLANKPQFIILLSTRGCVL